MEIGVESHSDIRNEVSEEIKDSKKPFKCDECDITFTYRSAIYRHRIKVHGEGKRYKCSLCDYVCFYKSYLETHSLLHSAEKPYKCNMCDYTCKTPAYLKSHELYHNLDREKYKCNNCSSSFPTLQSLNRHELSVHKQEKRFSCHLCSFVTFYKTCLMRHLIVHSGIKSFKCSVCDRAFYDSSQLKKHQRIHSKAKSQKLVKSGAPLFHPRELTIDQHQPIQHKPLGSTSDHDSTQGRDQIVQSLGHIENNIKSSHEDNFNEESLEHTGNNEKFTHASNLNEQSLECPDDNVKCTHDSTINQDQSTKCESKISQNMHRPRRKVDKRKLHTCPLCDYVTSNKGRMKIHSFSHSDERPYKCSVCGYTYKTLKYLKYHERCHRSDRKNYKCGQCPSIFHEIKNLKRHELAVHKKEKQLKCNLCNYKTFYKNYMKNHLTVHSGIKSNCGEGSSAIDSAKSLKTHQELVHEDLFDCSPCDFVNLDEKNLQDRVTNKEKPHQSNESDDASNNLSNLNQSRWVHIMKNTYKCDKCSATFETANGLEQHQKLDCRQMVMDYIEQRNVKDKLPFKTKCKECDAYFLKRSSLKKHISSFHEVQRLKMPHKCIDCNFYTYALHELRNHILNHSYLGGLKVSWKCSVCPAQYKSSVGLRLHKMEHTGQLPFKCSNCDSVFKQVVLLNYHMSNNH